MAATVGLPGLSSALREQLVDQLRDSLGKLLGGVGAGDVGLAAFADVILRGLAKDAEPAAAVQSTRCWLRPAACPEAAGASINRGKLAINPHSVVYAWDHGLARRAGLDGNFEPKVFAVSRRMHAMKL